MAADEENSLQSPKLTNEEFLIRHSYDAVVFPRNLEMIAERVSIKSKDSENNCDIYAVYFDKNNEFNYKFAQLKSDINGIPKNRNKMYTVVHQVS